MNPGLPPVPEPPHDPRSLLLNARTGFRRIDPPAGQTGVVEDPRCCVLVLPEAPAAQRRLDESSGSLGGIRLPSTAAFGPDGSLFVLDRARARLRRFDSCTCAFVDVPCVGDSGSGPRQLLHPGVIAADREALYVCDTGNGRVSVFSLRGFTLRGHLRPPAGEPAWRPVAVSTGARGRVWVADALGRVHRFDGDGSHHRSWPVALAPDHIAADGDGRIFVIASDVAVHVLNASGVLLDEAPATPAEAARSFPQLPFEVDSQGRLHLTPLCVDSCECHTRTGGGVFDADGNPIVLQTGPAAPTYVSSALYRSAALDSGIAQCTWHRLVLSGELPTGCRIRVRASCADEPIATKDLDALAAWHHCADADRFDGGGTWDCLLRANPGRYLWLEMMFEGTGAATPSIREVLVEFPRVSLRRYLPAVFGMDPVSADFTDRFLALFDVPLRRIEGQVDRMARLFDPASAPAVTSDPRRLDFLTWLGTWIGVSVDRNWDVGTRRRFIKRAGALFDRRGTVRGLREQLLLLLDFASRRSCEPAIADECRCVPRPLNCAPPRPETTPEMPPLVLEHFRLRRWLRIGRGQLGDAAVVWGERLVGRTRLAAHGQLGATRLDASPDPERDPFLVHANQFSVFVPARYRHDDRSRKALENLVRTEAPAATRGYLHFVEPRFRIGIQSMLGFDTVVAAVPQGVELRNTPLGDGSVLTGAAHVDGQGLAIGKTSRVGTTARLG